MQHRCFRLGTLFLTLMLAACSWQSVPPTPEGPASLPQNVPLTQNEGFKTLYAFPGGAGGQTPTSGFVFVNGTLYGTAVYGGITKNCTFVSVTPGCGLIFSIDPSGHEKVIYRFKGPSSHDGDGPGRLLLVGGKMYGQTNSGGLSGGGCAGDPPKPPGCGTVYEVDTAGNERVIYRFKGGSDGDSPIGGLAYANGRLYGATIYGGTKTNCVNSTELPRGCGVVYSLDLKSGKETVLYRFKGTPDGALPSPALITLNGAIYGTTYYGGPGCSYYALGCGTVYKVTPSGAESVVYAFKAMRDGAFPSALIAVGGSLYGTTPAGGCTKSCKFSPLGTFYKLSLSGKETIIHRFTGPPKDGMHPQGHLVLLNGVIYGASAGGAQGSGAIYSATSKGIHIIYSFARPPNPYDPNGLSMRPSTDELYGGASGGKYDVGYVYRFSL